MRDPLGGGGPLEIIYGAAVAREEGSSYRESRRMQRRSDVTESLRSIPEPMEQQNGGAARSAQIYRLRAGYQAGDSASWPRSITYDAPLRWAIPEPTSRPSASAMDSRVAPTISHRSR